MDEKQLSLLDNHEQADNGPVVCLGMTFKNDEERREYFRNELRKKMPELKKLEGFPIGDDEDIIALSDPPYYTACPNPWINDFIEEWEREKKEKYGRDDNEEYHREPFAADVSEGKNDPIYNAHTYHTKVPHKAIMHYILHYTKPGDIVFDGFAGTGMTGVAAYLCGNEEVIKELGYTINQGQIIDNESKEVISYIGERRAILNDLSALASFISKGFNITSDLSLFEKEAKEILKKVELEFGWLYKTRHCFKNGNNSNNDLTGTINYVVWSDVHICPTCANEIIFDTTDDLDSKKVKGKFTCKYCGSLLSKRGLEKAWITILDEKKNKILKVVKQIPVKINYTFNDTRYEKEPDELDLQLIDKVNNMIINEWYPQDPLPIGYNTNQPINSHGFAYPELFYTKRNLLIVSKLRSEAKKARSPLLLFWLNSIDHGISKRVKHGNWSFPMSILSGTLYIPSLSRENNPFYFYKNKLNKQVKVLQKLNGIKNIISTQSSSSMGISPESIDYIFVDPPFGANLMYSELNFILESWMRCKTNSNSEAIVNSVVNKDLSFYRDVLIKCFEEFYRILKPGRWMTVEFSNSQASVWNIIQEAILKSGFVIANVSALDKKQGSFKAVTTTTAVKQDLVISAYKPKQENIEKMKREQNTEESAWTFVRQHLEQLPVFIGHKGEAQIIAERTPRILFDRMVAYHVQNGLPVPISSAEFQAGVAQRFPMRDGMAFLESQVAEYDKKRTLVKEFVQTSLFVTDETSAIEWLRQQLLKKPQTRQDLHPNFMKEIQHIAKHEKLPELDDLLHQNFLKYEGEGPVPDQIASYLRKNYKDLRGLENDDAKLKEKAMNRWYVPDPNKQADLEKLREKALLREFEGYLEELEKSKKKLKQFRTEAIRAGFKKAWSEKDYEKIVKVGDRLPESVIQEDDKLLMYYDNAQIRLGL